MTVYIIISNASLCLPAVNESLRVTARTPSKTIEYVLYSFCRYGLTEVIRHTVDYRVRKLLLIDPAMTEMISTVFWYSISAFLSHTTPVIKRLPVTQTSFHLYSFMFKQGSTILEQTSPGFVQTGLHV